MGVKVLSILLLGVLAISAVSALHVEHHAELDTDSHQRGFFGNLFHKFNGWMPWSSKLGSDGGETLLKVEHIYQKTHANAQKRVDELKEGALKGKQMQEEIARIYAEEAANAERQIEALQTPFLNWLTHSRRTDSDDETESSKWSDKLSDKYESGKDYAKDKFESAKDYAKDKFGSSKTDQVKDAAKDAKDYAKDKFDSAKDKASKVAHDASKEASTLAGKAKNLGEKVKDEVTGFGKKVAGKFDRKDHITDKVKDEVSHLSKKLSQGYKSALDQAKEGAEKASNVAGDTWEDQKTKIKELYDAAFHKGHGKSRTYLGRLRDSIGRGLWSTGGVAKTAAIKTWDAMWHLFAIIGYGGIGMALGIALTFLGWRRRFFRQINSNISGPVVCLGEFMVLGGEEKQRKWFDFWSTTGVSFWSRQPGLRKQWLERGVGQANNEYLSYTEWASVEDLRKASKSREYADLLNRAPKASLSKMTLFQITASGHGLDSGLYKDTTAGLRQRSAVSSSS